MDVGAGKFHGRMTLGTSEAFLGFDRRIETDPRPLVGTQMALPKEIGTMPLLQFDTTCSLSPDERTTFADRVTALYTEEMETSAGHVAVTIREHEPSALHLGRAVAGALLFLDAEIRRGRSFERKRAFALAVMEYAGETLEVPDENMKVVFTEHEGQAMMGVDRVGGEWSDE